MDLDFAFFDSHGSLWLSCAANAPGATAFGPLGVAREVSADEAAAAGWPGAHYAAWVDTDDGAEGGEWGDGWCRPTSTRARAEAA